MYTLENLGNIFMYDNNFLNKQSEKLKCASNPTLSDIIRMNTGALAVSYT